MLGISHHRTEVNVKTTETSRLYITALRTLYGQQEGNDACKSLLQQSNYYVTNSTGCEQESGLRLNFAYYSIR